LVSLLAWFYLSKRDGIPKPHSLNNDFQDYTINVIGLIYNSFWYYIHNNPVKAELVANQRQPLWTTWMPIRRSLEYCTSDISDKVHRKPESHNRKSSAFITGLFLFLPVNPEVVYELAF